MVDKNIYIDEESSVCGEAYKTNILEDRRIYNKEAPTWNVLPDTIAL